MSNLFDPNPACNGGKPLSRDGRGRANFTRSRQGDALRDSALSLLRARRAALIRECTGAALRVALCGGEVSADDVRALVTIPPDISPKFVGVVFRDLADAGILRRVRFQNSKRPVAHARPLSLWRLADAAGAAAWLAAHPPLTTA